MGLANESGSPRGRTRSGHPRLRTSQSSAEQDVDARDKPGHGELGDQGLGGTVGEALDETAAALAAARLGLGERASFVAGDWGAGLAGGFDAVVANPPYIATADLAALMPEVRDHDPRRALDGGADGLAAYRAIARDLPRLLVPGGLLAAEIGLGQADSVAEIIIAGGLAVERVAPDLAGIARVVLACRLG